MNIHLAAIKQNAPFLNWSLIYNISINFSYLSVNFDKTDVFCTLEAYYITNFTLGGILHFGTHFKSKNKDHSCSLLSSNWRERLSKSISLQRGWWENYVANQMKMLFTFRMTLVLRTEKPENLTFWDLQDNSTRVFHFTWKFSNKKTFL